VDSHKPGPLRAGETFLGKYEVRGILGHGGHAFVYEAYDPFLDRAVALKVIKSPQDTGGNLGKRARAEAQVLSRIDHKNLVKVLDAGISDGLVYLIMEKLVGRTLRDVLKDLHRLSLAEALTIGLQVTEGVDVAHRQQVIHRDLKPENIFIEAGNSVKVLDFGIAKVLGVAGHRPETTERDLLQGTVLYMSPEHLQGFGVTPKSDIYALGTILFEALYAHPLSVGERPAGLQEAAWMQIAKLPPMLDELDRAIPHFVAKLVQRAIVKMPEQRYSSMRDFREAISAAIARLRDEAKTQPARFTLRDLSSTQAVGTRREAKPRSGRDDAARVVPSLTSQVTVPAPYVSGGDTEPVSKLPFSTSAAHAAPTPLLLGTVVGATRAREAHTPLIFGAVQRPASTPPLTANSSEKPTLYAGSNPVAPGSLSRATSTVSHLAEQPTRAIPPVAVPATAASSAKQASLATKSVPPSTAPPVSSRVAAAPVRVPGPLINDRRVKIAALAALVVGVVGGSAFGLIATRAEPESNAGVIDVSATASQVTDPFNAPATPQGAAASVSPLAVTPAPTGEAPVAASSVTPEPPVAIRRSAVATAPSAPPKAPSAVRATNARTATDSQLQERLDWLDRDSTKPKTLPAPAKPGSERSRETVF
jgi:eukaryotic-like serine/threonine-protein kinase